MNQAKQKFLGPYGLIVFIALLSAFIPLSTDLYLPALPGMSSYFKASPGQINLTLTAFFAIYALGILIWGPLPVLVAGIAALIGALLFEETLPQRSSAVLLHSLGRLGRVL